MITIVDFGSQTTHLIGRRLRELGASVTIESPDRAVEVINKQKPRGIIFSGGPSSVYEKGSPTIDKEVFRLNTPILGLCYGQQLIAHLLGGRAASGKKKEFGPAEVIIKRPSIILKSFKNNVIASRFTAWMSHGDEVQQLPPGFVGIAHTKTIPYAAYEHPAKRIFGLQFHPEVIHTQFGTQILKNFLTACGIKPKKQTIDKKLIQSLIADIKDSIGDKKAIAALSGGVDSSVATLLVYKAIGENLSAIYIDSGLMREGETELLKNVFKKHYHMKVIIVDATREFLKNLSGIADPEEKRRIIGRTFIKVFEKEARKKGASFLVQGTIYPDVIESKGSQHADRIKSHHNVAALPQKMRLVLVEPLRTFYKDEVRNIGKLLDLSKKILERHPFPGPGLATRIVGEVTERKLTILRRADAIVQEEIEKADLSQKLWQVFAVYTGIKTTGVRGDASSYGETIAIRAVEAQDAMTAHWSRLSYNLLNRMGVRIANEIKEVNRVVYDITNKPPATIEWE